MDLCKPGVHFHLHMRPLRVAAALPPAHWTASPRRGPRSHVSDLRLGTDPLQRGRTGRVQGASGSGSRWQNKRPVNEQQVSFPRGWPRGPPPSEVGCSMVGVFQRSCAGLAPIPRNPCQGCWISHRSGGRALGIHHPHTGQKQGPCLPTKARRWDDEKCSSVTLCG